MLLHKKVSEMTFKNQEQNLSYTSQQAVMFNAWMPAKIKLSWWSKTPDIVERLSSIEDNHWL